MKKVPSRRQIVVKSKPWIKRLRFVWIWFHRRSVNCRLEKPFFRTSYMLAAWLLGNRYIQKTVFQKQRSLLQYFLKYTGLRDDPDLTLMVRKQLMNETLLLWRYADPVYETTAKEIAKDITVENWHLFEQAYQSGRGVLFAMSHYGLSRAILPFMRRRHYDGPCFNFNSKKHLRSGNAELIDTERVMGHTQDLIEIKQALSSGGTAYILADGGAGVTSITFPFYGRMRQFKLGFVDLALATGACVMPITAVPGANGKLTITFFPQLDSGSQNMSQPKPEEMLVRQYAEHLTQIWALSPSNIMQSHIYRFLYDNKKIYASNQA